jgi:hypothetical protein
MDRALTLERVRECRRAAGNRQGLGDTPDQVPRILGPVHAGTAV